MDFFAANPLLVRQPQKFWSWNSEYHCFDHHGRQIAHVHQDTSDSGSRFFQQWMTGSSQSKVFVRDAWGHVRLVIQKHWALATATTHVTWPDGRPVGTIEQDFTFFKSGFTLIDPWKNRIGTIEGDFFARDFRISDHRQHEVARVDRSIPDIGELFSSADTYAMHRRYPSLPEPLSTLVVAAAITIDLVLRENSSGSAIF